jgi:hypothetical protein
VLANDVPDLPSVCSLNSADLLIHIRGRTFAAFGDEIVDPRGHNSESIREQAGGGTEPSSSTAAPARVTRIQDQNDRENSCIISGL